MGRAAPWLVALLVAAGCGNDRGDRPAHDAGRARRVFEKPREVRAVPPHAIRADGVGPYLLGAPLTDVLDLLPHGPRVVLLEIEGLLDFSLIRAEEDGLLIGAERSTGVAYVVVLDREIARTEAGIAVGATAAELDEALGEHDEDPLRLRDPRLRVFAAMPGVRFLVDNDKVAAVVVGLDGRPGSRRSPAEPAPPAGRQPVAAPRCAVRAGIADEAVATARLDADRPRVVTGCLGADPIAIVSGGERIAVVGGEPGKLRRIDQPLQAHGLEFAGPLDIDRDGRDEVALVGRRDEDGVRTWKIEVYRLEQGKLVRKLDKDAYSISTRSAQLVGARLEDVDLLLDLWSDGESVRVGGLFLHRGERGPRNLAPLRPRPPYRWRVAEPPLPAADADAGVPAPRRPAGGQDPAAPAEPADRSPP